MKISRKGAFADHGVGSIELKNIAFKWSTVYDSLEMRSDDPVRDFKTTSRHNYRIRMSLKEAAEFIESLAEGCKEIDSEEFVSKIGPVLGSLNKISARASGIF